MTFTQAFISLAAATLLAFGPAAVHTFTTACTYEEYQCGYTLVNTNGYNNTELTAAVNKTGTIPPLTTVQLLQTLYRCEDTQGAIAGNSYCIAGCISMDTEGIEDDQCAM